MNKKNTFTLRLSDQQLEILKGMAKRERRTAAAILRNLIDDFGTREQNNKQSDL